jgi:hypothetical protein
MKQCESVIYGSVSGWVSSNEAITNDMHLVLLPLQPAAAAAEAEAVAAAAAVSLQHWRLWVC